MRPTPCCTPSLMYLFSDVQTETVTVSVVQLLRIVVRRLLRAHVVNGPASKGRIRRAGLRRTGWGYVWLTYACRSSLQQVVTYVYNIIYCSALNDVSFSPSSNLFSLLMPDCTSNSIESKKGVYSLTVRMSSQSDLLCRC